MSQIYADRKRTKAKVLPTESEAPASPLDALRSGAAAPTAEQMGHRVDLPDAMRAKMENAFGADLSAVKLYESQAVADAGANAVAQGANIAFAPGMLDFSSYGGQALLGHEISHVVSQARGEVTGGGFLNDHALEARADREGAMAAAGESVAMPTAAMSSVTAAAAAGPMQADKKAEKAQARHDAASMRTDFNNHIFNPTFGDFGGHDEGRDRFEDTARNTSRRGVRAVDRMVRQQQKKYERQMKGHYTREELFNEENRPAGVWGGTKDLQRDKDRELLSLLNMQRAFHAVREGKGYSVSHDLSDFTDRKGNSYSGRHDPSDFLRR